MRRDFAKAVMAATFASTLVAMGACDLQARIDAASKAGGGVVEEDCTGVDASGLKEIRKERKEADEV